MADVFKILGSYTTAPVAGSPSADPSMAATIDEQLSLDRKHYREYVLDSDAVVSVDFGGLDAAHALVVKCVGGKVRVRATSTDGTSQAVPVDSFMAVISESVPFTAIDVTREAGIEVRVKIFLGEKA